eukprot:TRINITY_DN2661_c0_g2_i3.p1 TRINITY_DN2661_c0_g2~~TRINITY_DN2661_c0_g2_i3.p1  ORF type:complete len:292 (+),score=19.92 TRINITY_DN2661_c0_g2_i3:34-909(+)
MVMGGRGMRWCVAATAALWVGAAAQNTTSTTSTTGETLPPKPGFHPHVGMCFAMNERECPGQMDCTMADSKIRYLQAAVAEVARTNGAVQLNPTCAKTANCKEGCEVTFEVDEGTDTSILERCSGDPETYGCAALLAEGLKIYAAADEMAEPAPGGSGIVVMWVVLAVLGTCLVGGIAGTLYWRKLRRDARRELGIEHLEDEMRPQDNNPFRAEMTQMQSPLSNAQPPFAAPPSGQSSAPPTPRPFRGRGGSTPPPFRAPGRNGSVPPSPLPTNFDPPKRQRGLSSIVTAV